MYMARTASIILRGQEHASCCMRRVVRFHSSFVIDGVIRGHGSCRRPARATTRRWKLDEFLRFRILNISSVTWPLQRVLLV